MDIGAAGHGLGHNSGYVHDVPEFDPVPVDLITSGSLGDLESTFEPGISEETFDHVEAILAELELHELRYRCQIQERLDLALRLNFW